MRTLAKPQKAKPQVNKQGEKKDNNNNNNSGGNKQSKKVMKTVFHSPFRYKMQDVQYSSQALSVDDADIVLNMLIKYAETLRAEFGSEVKAVKNQKFISFNSKVKLTKPTLAIPHFVYGVKECTRKLKKKDNPIHLIIIFYDQSKHDNFQELLCSVIYYKTPYLILRDSQKLRQQLGLKQLLALGLTAQQFSNDLSPYCSKCMIEIPWLVDDRWIPLS